MDYANNSFVIWLDLRAHTRTRAQRFSDISNYCYFFKTIKCFNGDAAATHDDDNDGGVNAHSRMKLCGTNLSREKNHIFSVLRSICERVQ